MGRVVSFYLPRMSTRISNGVAHSVPDDLRNLLMSHTDVLKVWESLTPLARNEWICWVESVKKAETRKEHVARVRIHLLEGQRRPCCWPGCPHREKNKRTPA